MASIATAKGIDILMRQCLAAQRVQRRYATFIVGGKDGAFNRAEPILQAIGKHLSCRQQWRRTRSQDLQQHASGHLDEWHAEAINLGVKNGLDNGVLTEIMLQAQDTTGPKFTTTWYLRTSAFKPWLHRRQVNTCTKTCIWPCKLLKISALRFLYGRSTQPCMTITSKAQ